MATLADSLVSSASRPLTLRMRPDLTARKQRYHGQTYWVVKEPIGLNYYRFHEEEYAILCMMDGRCSLESIKERFEQEFTPQKITFQDLQQFVGMLHRSGLVVADAIGQGHQLRKRRDQKKRRELLGKVSNVFALRWRGIDPERILNRIYPYTSWFFTKPVMIFNVLVALSALMLIAVQFDVFRARLPSFHQFFGNWQNWLVMAIAMAIAKVLHEFGHGLSCKHYGGECHEMGFMLLVFTPALYCNVSDSWMLPSKWKRAFIGAAGMYVEMALASTATFIWWFTDRTSLLNQICLSLMFICSVSTLLFNGNPLLRFDGYYILMDLIEIPNLRQKATEVLKRFVVQLCLGIEQPENPFLPQSNRFLFGLYTVAAVCYRWIVVFSILMFLNKVLEPYGLKVIGRLVGLMGLFGLIVQPIWQLGKFFYMPGRMHKVKRHRVIASLAVVAALIAVFLFVPLPFHLNCEFDVKPRDAATVYAAVDGRLDDGQLRTHAVLAGVDRFDRAASLLDQEADKRKFHAVVQDVIQLMERMRAKESEIVKLRDDFQQDASLSKSAKADAERRIKTCSEEHDRLKKDLIKSKKELFPLVEAVRGRIDLATRESALAEISENLRKCRDAVAKLDDLLQRKNRLLSLAGSGRGQVNLTTHRGAAGQTRDDLAKCDADIAQLLEASVADKVLTRPAEDVESFWKELLATERVLRQMLDEARDELYPLKDELFRLTILAWDARQTVRPGDQVQQGQVLAVLLNLDLELTVVALEGQLAELDAELSVLRKQQRFDENAGMRINELDEQREALKQVLFERKDELHQLVVRAPIAGTALPVADKPDRDPPEGQLPGWVGAVLQPSNQGAFLSASDRICQIGDPNDLVAEIIINQADVELVRAAMVSRDGQQPAEVPVVLMLDSLADKSFDGIRIERVALAELKETPLGLSTHAGGDVDSVIDPQTGIPKPLSTSYPAIAEFPDVQRDVQLGMRGKAKLYTGWQPLGRRFYRFLMRTFHFEL